MGRMREGVRGQGQKRVRQLCDSVACIDYLIERKIYNFP